MVPCKDCLTFPICKQQVIGATLFRYYSLVKKCSTLASYLEARTVGNTVGSGTPLILYQLQTPELDKLFIGDKSD